MATTLPTGIVLPDSNDNVSRLAYRGNLETINDKLIEGESALIGHLGDYESHLVNYTSHLADFTTLEENFNNHLADYVRQPGYGITTGSATAYTLTLSPALTAYTAGVCVAVKIHSTNTGACTLNVNGRGAKSLRKADGSTMEAGDLAANGVYTFRYDGTNFIYRVKEVDLRK